MDIRKVPISKVVPWDENPKTASPEDLARLKAQVLKLDVYKPLIAYKDGDKYVVLGGNQRLKVYRELGHKEVVLSVVTAKTLGGRLEISISDNDRAGYYDPEGLAELLFEQKDAIDMGLFKIDLGVDESLATLLETMGKTVLPTEVYGSDRKEGGPVICPNCGAVVEEGGDGA